MLSFSVFSTVISIQDACFLFFFFNDTATTEIYTLSLHDALPICGLAGRRNASDRLVKEVHTWCVRLDVSPDTCAGDRKSTRLNSSHLVISYAVFCLKKKTNTPFLVVSSRAPLSHHL